MTPSLRKISGLALTAAVLTACATSAANLPLDVGGAPAASPRLTATLDAIVRDAFPADAPGAAAIVVRDGEVLLRAGYGMADLERGVAMRPEHVFRIGSITKQFTGVAILMLAEEGKLSLDDPITRFLPDYPTGGRTVTIEQLLAHTSGIRSYTSMPEWEPTRRTDLSVSELIALFREEPFDFEPGENWLYNNSGYILLGAVVEAVSGMSYAEFVETRIFEVLGMEGASYDVAARITPNRIPGYSRGPDGWVNAEYLSMTHPYAAGSLLASVDDLARWDAAITRGELLSDAGWRRAFTPVRLNDGRSTEYGAGWLRGRIGPYETIEHGGGINGFLTNAIRVPEAKLFVAVLTNADAPAASPATISLRLADAALGGVMDEPEVPIAAERLPEFVGVYRIDEGNTRTISLADGRLVSQRTGGARFDLRPVGDDLFVIPGSGTRFRFERGPQGVVAVVSEPRAGMRERAERVADEVQTRRAITLPSEAYDAYPGTYRLAPNFDFRVTREGDQLYAQATGQPRTTLRPESPTHFFVVEVDAVIEFEIADGRAIGIILHQGGQSMPAPRVD